MAEASSFTPPTTTAANPVAPQGASSGEPSATARKRLFVGLISGTSLLLCLTLVLLWIIPYLGLRNIHPYAPWVLGAVLAALIVLVLWACLGLLLNLALGRSLPLTRRLRGLTIKLLLPLMTLLAMALNISKERVRSSFIKVNNELVSSPGPKFKPSEILLLMPHCLQNSRCDKRLTYNINNCARCGLCPIAGLLSLSEHYGVHLAIATGGTIARRIVVQKRPKIILAVACERDLASGIQDTYPIPVYGVLNERPKGPCLDTLVPLDRLEDAIVRFMEPASLPTRFNDAPAQRAHVISVNNDVDPNRQDSDEPATGRGPASAHPSAKLH